MYDMSWALRSKQAWQPKAPNPYVRRKWRQEALEQAAAAVAASEDLPGLRLTEKMVGKRSLRNPLDLFKFCHRSTTF